MSDQHNPQTPSTLLEYLFGVIDSVARKLIDFRPLSRGIRNVIKSSPEGLISWDHVREIGIATLNLQKEKPGPVSPHMAEQYQVMLKAAQRVVADYTGLEAARLPSEAEIFRQEDWIAANIVSFRFLFEPISEKYVAFIEELGSRGGERARKMAHTLLTIQVGVVMGYLARNVLGQYDLSLPEPESDGRLYVVEPNVKRIQSLLGLEPREFRQWITLHEVTHLFEFHSNDWLKNHLSSSMQDYLKTIDWRAVSRPEFFKRIRNTGVEREDALKAGGLISIMSTPEQKKILVRLQAIMCLLEGYSNHVMDRVGEDMLATYSTMKERFERRRALKSGSERLFERLIGIDLKLEQYRLGQAFVDEVVKREGISFMNRAWVGPQAMPTMDEIYNPSDWIERIGSLDPQDQSPGR